MKKISALLPILLASATLMACTPTQTTRGNIVEDFRMGEITPGISTRNNVLKSLGSPTTTAPFDDNVWYYIGQKMEKNGIFDPKVTEERVVVVAFNEDGIVETLEEIDNQRMDIPRVRDKTKTGGNDITILEQVLGNVGRFNKNGGSLDTGGGSR